MCGVAAGPTGRRSHSSGAAVADGDRLAVNNDGNFPLAARQFQHGGKIFRVGFDVNIIVVSVGLPGPARVGSTGFPIDDDLIRHGMPPRWGY